MLDCRMAADGSTEDLVTDYAKLVATIVPVYKRTEDPQCKAAYRALAERATLTLLDRLAAQPTTDASWHRNNSTKSARPNWI